MQAKKELSGEETELDLTGQDLVTGDVVLISNEIKSSTVLAKFTFGSELAWRGTPDQRLSLWRKT